MSQSNEPRWVQRDPSTGEIVGSFANEQEYAHERISEDHPEHVAFRAKREEARKAAISPFRSLENRVASLEQIVAELRAKVG